jgi:hypothetical protein
LIVVSIQNSLSPFSTISEKLQKYTVPKEELKSIWQMNAVYKVPIALFATGIIPKNI